MNPTTANPLALCWSIEESYALQMQEQMQRLDLKAASSRGNSANSTDDPPPYEVRDGVAILSLTGPLSKTLSWWSWFFGGTSTVAFRDALRQAAADPAVKAILIDCDSPGGTTAGTADLADDVAALARQMPVIAYVSDLCCSAALWICAQCTSVFGGATSMVGSIGTVMVMTDSSRAAENAGFSVHVISTGKYKGAGARGATIAPEHLADWQRIADDVNAEFIAAVARGRKMTPEAVAALADGRVHVGKAAQELGLIDGIASLDTVLQQMQQRPAAGTRGKETNRTMGLMTMIRSMVAAYKAEGGQLSEEETKELAAAEAALKGEAAAHAPTRFLATDPKAEYSPKPDPELTARLDAQTKANEALLAQNAEILKRLERQETSARLERHRNEIAMLVASGKMSPAERDDPKDGYLALAEKDPDAFEASLPALKLRQPNPAFFRRNLTHIRTEAAMTSEDAAEKLTALTQQRAKEKKISMLDAAAEIERENPDLARAHKASVRTVGGNN